MFRGKTILITGGTGSFGKQFTGELLDKYDFGKIIILSRDEFKQDLMKKEFTIKYGAEAMKKLASSRIAVFGIGGVGGYAVEALARSGVGALDLIDDDRVCLTNLNRQIFATRKTVGKYKAEVMRDRMLEIKKLEREDVQKVIAFERELRRQEPDTYYWEPDEAFSGLLSRAAANAPFLWMRFLLNSAGTV